MSAAAMPAIFAGLNVAQMVASQREQAAAQNHQAALAQAQAERERQLAAQQADDYRRRQGAALAAMRARRGASGVALAGSPLLADDAAQQDTDLGAARILAGGVDRASRLEDQAAMARYGAQTMPSSYLRYGTTLLRGLDGSSFWKDLWRNL
jgi:hypothetical protein